jgi:hypothetical protein
MRRLVLLVPVVVAGSLALTGCSGAGPTGEAAGKSATSTSAAHGKPVDRVTVIDGMHYVQLFNAVDPVMADIQTSTDGPPPSTELRNAAASLHQFATQARDLPSSGSAGQTVHRLAVASTTLAAQLTTLASSSGKSNSSVGLNSAVASFRTAAAAARKAAGLPAVATSSKPRPDTGP